jgi:hypothetical protein
LKELLMMGIMVPETCWAVFFIFAPWIFNMKVSLLKSNWWTLCNYIHIKIYLNYITHCDMFRSTQRPSSGSSSVLN